MTDLAETAGLSEAFDAPDFDEAPTDAATVNDERHDDIDDDGFFDDGSMTHAEFDGDTGNLTADVRDAIVALMTERFISSDTHKREWKALVGNTEAVRTQLHNMYLDVEVDDRYEVAYKFQVRSQDSGRGYPILLRAMSWNREQTALLVHLRVFQRNQLASGVSRVVVNDADIHAHFAALRPKTATDHHMDATRVKTAIEATKRSGLLAATKQPGVYIVSPVLERLLPLPKLRELLSFFNTETGEDSE